jgi:hypothetical protein
MHIFFAQKGNYLKIKNRKKLVKLMTKLKLIVLYFMQAKESAIIIITTTVKIEPVASLESKMRAEIVTIDIEWLSLSI